MRDGIPLKRTKQRHNKIEKSSVAKNYKFISEEQNQSLRIKQKNNHDKLIPDQVQKRKGLTHDPEQPAALQYYHIT